LPASGSQATVNEWMICCHEDNTRFLPTGVARLSPLPASAFFFRITNWFQPYGPFCYSPQDMERADHACLSCKWLLPHKAHAVFAFEKPGPYTNRLCIGSSEKTKKTKCNVPCILCICSGAVFCWETPVACIRIASHSEWMNDMLSWG